MPLIIIIKVLVVKSDQRDQHSNLIINTIMIKIEELSISRDTKKEIVDQIATREAMIIEELLVEIDIIIRVETSEEVGVGVKIGELANNKLEKIARIITRKGRLRNKQGKIINQV